MVATIVLFFVAIISLLIWLVYILTKNPSASMIKCCCIWLFIVLLATIVILSLLLVPATRDYPENSKKKHSLKKNWGDTTTPEMLQNIIRNKSKFLKYIGWVLGLNGLAWLLLCCLPCCFGKGRKNFGDDVIRSNRRSNYTKMIEDKYPEQFFNPNT